MAFKNSFPSLTLNPNVGNIFLRSDNGNYRYADLKNFEYFFLKLLNDSDYDFQKPIGLLVPSSDLLVFIIAACWDLGIPFVSFNATASKQELKNQLSDMDTGLLFSEESNLFNTGRECIDISNFDLDAILESNKKDRPNIDLRKKEINVDDIFGYIFTSGTSGSPKIVPLKRRQMLYAADASAKNLKPDPNHLWLLCLPLNHIGGISIIFRSLLYGSAIYRMDKFESETVSQLLSDERQFQAASLVPTMLKRLIERPDFDIHENFKAILLGGGPIDKSIIDRARKRNIPLILSYGMTETCAQIAANPLFESNSAPSGSVGTIFSPNEIDIRTEKGESLPTGSSGTIWLRGPQVFEGYQNRKIKHVFDSEGWFNTGDYGNLDEEGQLFIETRRTDLIISGGENISPYEVEMELENISSIKEAAVIGLPDEEWGQKVVAIIVSPSDIDENIIRKKLKAKLSDFKIPKIIRRVKEIPRTRTGKIRREKLIDYFKNSESA